MNGITKSTLAPHDEEWSHVHKKLGCHDCTFAARDRLDQDSCCTHSDGVKVDLNFRCVRKRKR